MSTVLRYLEFLSLGTWVGSIVYLSFAVAPGAFATLGSRDQAGAVVGMALARLHAVGFIAGFVFLGARVALARAFSALASPVAALVILMLLLTGVSQHWVSPRMAQLRGEMGSVDATSAEHPLRREFNRLHRISVWAESTVLLLGLAALFLIVRERSA